MRLPFFFKSSLMLHFLAFQRQSRFCVNEYIAKNYTKIICIMYFWSLWCSFPSNPADFEISIFNLTHKVPPSTSFEIRKSLKRMPSLAYTEMDQTKYRVSSMFAFGCIIWILLHVCASSKMVLASKLVLASIMVLTSLYIGPDWHLLWCANQTLKWSWALNVNICKPNPFST